MTFDVIGISETKEQAGKGFLTQFIVLNKFDIDYKTFSYAKRDYSKFDEQKFISDFSCKSMAFLDDPSLSLNCKFEKFYQKLSSCIEPTCTYKENDKK